MIFEKYKPLILGLWALFSFSVYSGNLSSTYKCNFLGADNKQ